jgi:multidrug efflux pump subunit AcrB
MPVSIADLNDIPIKYVDGQTVFLKDVGQVHDGWAVQQNVVHQDGRRSVLLSVLKNGNASTVAVVNGVRKALQIARAAAPPGLSINELFDQSKLVTRSINGVLREGAIAAGLTGLMILLFLGSWRSTLIVLISIPLSILASIVILHFMGHTLNTMTLGGMALAVGILVDDSTVTISRRGYPARFCRHRGADHGFDTRDQLRIHVGGVPRRAGEIPVYPARARCRVRHARVLCAVAHIDAGHDRPAA